MAKDKQFSKIIVGLIILLNLAFTVAVLYLFYITQDEPRALIIAWFAFTTGELAFLAGIRIKENSRGEDGRDADYHRSRDRTKV